MIAEAEGTPIAKLVKFKTKEKEAEGEELFEELEGVAVDGSGTMFLYSGNELIFRFNNAEKNGPASND